MIWTEKYRPAALRDIEGQDRIVAILSSCASAKTVPHLMLTGPHGTGKSAAIRCFARELYGENWETNTTIFQTSDLFLQGRKVLEEDERYAHLYQKGQSLIVNFKHILKWYASIRPLDADFKLMVFEDAHALTREAQQGLRRIMEQFSGTCRFVFSTTNPSAIIPAISSRCLPLSFAPVSPDLIILHLKRIREQEGAGTAPACTDDDLELIAAAAQGDMRRAVLMFQAASLTGSCSNLAALSQSETSTVAASALSLIKSGDTKSAIRQLESLMIDYGLSGREVIAECRTVAKREFNHPALARALAETDACLGHANSEYVQIDAFAIRIKEILS